MAPWPPVWRMRTLETAKIPVTSTALTVLKAWHDSTPLPSLTNNPLGMPSGMSGAPRYLNTPYAIFSSISAFYAAFATFIETSDGRNLSHAMVSEQAYSASWRIISSLHWPASVTETDYPAALLDLTSQSYQDSAKATDKSQRKSAGQVGANPMLRDAVVAQAHSVAQAAQTFSDAAKAMQHLIRKHGSDGR